ncbi:hypothetical protein [Natranaeroarchaeum sulfidigenes]|uniref:Uncharacterized protein n=1 Tax=Natranaeroarchaeum sulfidigenes TaxID=2784880 RepID=A0A897MIW7_9EURY|nr:hypothetical protein [Natranaeroarchaeum sulfidigenes]QSG02060.1 Uncharacterized protein AArcS_0836 [Natranaeroarchaeum sulfidigenes]
MTDSMQDVDHTHPFGDASAARSFERGPTVVTDGGSPESDETSDGQMADVDHVPPHGEGAAPAFERGGDRQADVVTHDEGVYNE